MWFLFTEEKNIWILSVACWEFLSAKITCTLILDIRLVIAVHELYLFCEEKVELLYDTVIWTLMNLEEH